MYQIFLSLHSSNSPSDYFSHALKLREREKNSHRGNKFSLSYTQNSKIRNKNTRTILKKNLRKFRFLIFNMESETERSRDRWILVEIHDGIFDSSVLSFPFFFFFE